MGTPPDPTRHIEGWSEAGAELALARFAFDLGRVGLGEALARLDLLTDAQRGWVLEQIDAWDPPERRRGVTGG